MTIDWESVGQVIGAAAATGVAPTIMAWRASQHAKRTGVLVMLQARQIDDANRTIAAVNASVNDSDTPLKVRVASNAKDIGEIKTEVREIVQLIGENTATLRLLQQTIAQMQSNQKANP